MGIGAGIPWYSALFGRDSAICALEIMPFLPNLACESIKVLASYQGKTFDKFTGEEPGKIMHELRLGELARQKIIPHYPYYGTCDATQLWLMSLVSYVDWSGDLNLASQLWTNVEAALNWIDKSMEKTGYITYVSTGEHDLVNQGWKDSHDSVMHKNGMLANPPIALCEAQAYVYKAWMDIARLARLLNKNELAQNLMDKANYLKIRFNSDFWLDNIQYIALAIDGDNKPCEVYASNAGHCLFSGILDNDRANLLADKILSADMYSSWGVRTLGRSCVAYNPMSYHNGTIWPHDNAIIAAGLAKYGRFEDVHTIANDLYDVTVFQSDYRLPELFCGFKRQDLFAPVPYPVSCSPQAFASASVFLFVQAYLNFEAIACESTLKIIQPKLPNFVNRLNISGLRLGNAVIDLNFEKNNDVTVCNVLRKSGLVKILVEN